VKYGLTGRFWMRGEKKTGRTPHEAKGGRRLPKKRGGEARVGREAYCFLELLHFLLFIAGPILPGDYLLSARFTAAGGGRKKKRFWHGPMTGTTGCCFRLWFFFLVELGRNPQDLAAYFYHPVL